jgi:hypothetical protein
MNLDSREKIRLATEAEAKLAKALARLGIAVAEVNLCQAEFASHIPSHWPEGSSQQFEEAEDRYEAVAEAREELTRAKGSLAELERAR